MSKSGKAPNRGRLDSTPVSERPQTSAGSSSSKPCDRLHALIEKILEADSHGDLAVREALVAVNPDLSDSLRDFFARRERIESATGHESTVLAPKSLRTFIGASDFDESRSFYQISVLWKS